MCVPSSGPLDLLSRLPGTCFLQISTRLPAVSPSPGLSPAVLVSVASAGHPVYSRNSLDTLTPFSLLNFSP